MKIAVVTDSTANITPEEAAQHDIHVVPIPFTIDGQTFREGVDISTEEFYDKLKNSSSFPSTSQPSIGQMMELYQQLADDGYDAAISIFLTSSISGFLSTVHGLVDEMKDKIQIIPFDCHITSEPMHYVVLEAAKLVKQHEDPDEVVSKLTTLSDSIRSLFVVDDLQNLVRGGRLSNASAFVGSILKIKPLLSFDNPSHSIEAFEKVRSMKKAKLRCEEIFEDKLQGLDYPVRAVIIHANAEEAGQKWVDKLSAAHPDVDFKLGYFGPVIGTHLGEGALALTWFRDTDKKPL
ncbi:MAG: DegV family protein [Limosilactobacillus sp.]|uniref:DegV family protein n=1 Tax=Limosilactobacillus sp. TaxID=2773925 RepID=UPI002705CEB9|nr:DegV family protein [Limosilactobacillus sp.]